MQDILGESLRSMKKRKGRRRRAVAILLVLSLIVSTDTFWNMRQPGLTLAGDADCRITEHIHDAHCQNPCPLQEHLHSIDCYSDQVADTETQLQWQDTFANYPYTGNLRTDLAAIAKTQVGYTESKDNFQTGDDGVRRGYTRYGAWYGAPYNDWSAMFVCYCLHYAGADPELYPANIGADSMAQLWMRTGKYAAAGTYTPAPGDLVFFQDNTVGIVTEVQSNTFYVVQGDQQNMVACRLLALSDASISGWGNTGQRPTQTPDPEQLDISQGPAFFLLGGDLLEEVPEETPPMQTFALRRTVTDLLPYLEANGGNYFFTLMDFHNVELPKDENGNYIAQANTGYKLAITFNSPNGFLPGTYEYQIPNGLMVDGGEGTFILKDGTNVGNWTVTDTGLITLEFNEHINSRTDITITSALGIHFPEQQDPIDFDGKIIVQVEKPPPQSNPTKVNKWGNQGGVPGANGTDPSKIYWGIEVIGDKDSQIIDNILTDEIVFGQWSKAHHFTESDMAAGLSFGVSDPYGGWHNWVVTPDDPRLIWTETGWSYKMPKTAVCQWCGEIELGNEGWIYYIQYSSTPDYAGAAGTYGYENSAFIDGATGYSWVNFTHGELTGEIIKQGSFVSDAAGGGFLWEFQATIPPRQEGKRADYHWYVMDYMHLLDQDGFLVGRVENDAHLATVYVTYQGNTFQIPRIQDATDADMFAYDNAWSAVENGITFGREFNLLTRCQCTPETCHWGGCDDYWYTKDDGTTASKDFCQCWTVTEPVTFTFVYKTTDLSIMEKYGPLNYRLYNEAKLYYKPDDNPDGALVDGSTAAVPIPGLFQKELTHDFDGYIANYKVTVNEAKLVLTNGTPLYIRDEMTDTLAYISGSLVITAEDGNGVVTQLQQGVDYTVTYDGTGGQTDDKGNEVHVLDIVILNPQPVMYLLDYDTTLLLPNVVTEGIKYKNSATITLWGQDIHDTTIEKVYADINIAAKNYKVEMFKTAAETGEPLAGATFGLYNAQGGLITTEVTNTKGQLLFQTSITEGIILREHIPYYMQELQAPPGYQLDDTKYWFCFCDKVGNSCQVCDEVLAGLDAVRIPFEQIGKVNATNQLMNYDLPATGGSGVYPLLLVSIIFIVIPLVYFSIPRRKRERRESG